MRRSISAEHVWTGRGAAAARTILTDTGRIVDVRDGFDPNADFVYRDALITPGLVNAHVHLDLTFDPTTETLEIPFTDWLLSMRDLREREGMTGMTRAAARGIELSIAHGTTTLVDYDATGASLEPLARSPIRRVVLREVIGFSSDFESRRSELDAFLASVPTAHEVRSLAPHAPYTVQRALLEGCSELTRRHARLWSTHLAEQPWEEELLRHGTGEYADWLRSLGIDLDRFGWPGETGLDYLDRLGLLETPGLLVHGNYIDPKSIAPILRSNSTIVACPRSHAFFHHARHPWPQLVANGARCILGTDGLVSSGSPTGGTLSLIDELRALRTIVGDIDPETPLPSRHHRSPPRPRQHPRHRSHRTLDRDPNPPSRPRRLVEHRHPRRPPPRPSPSRSHPHRRHRGLPRTLLTPHHPFGESVPNLPTGPTTGANTERV